MSWIYVFLYILGSCVYEWIIYLLLAFCFSCSIYCNLFDRACEIGSAGTLYSAGKTISDGIGSSSSRSPSFFASQLFRDWIFRSDLLLASQLNVHMLPFISMIKMKYFTLFPASSSYEILTVSNIVSSTNRPPNAWTHTRCSPWSGIFLDCTATVLVIFSGGCVDCQCSKWKHQHNFHKTDTIHFQWMIQFKLINKFCELNVSRKIYYLSVRNWFYIDYYWEYQSRDKIDKLPLGIKLVDRIEVLMRNNAISCWNKSFTMCIDLYTSAKDGLSSEFDLNFSQMALTPKSKQTESISISFVLQIHISFSIKQCSKFVQTRIHSNRIHFDWNHR